MNRELYKEVLKCIAIAIMLIGSLGAVCCALTFGRTADLNYFGEIEYETNAGLAFAIFFGMEIITIINVALISAIWYILDGQDAIRLEFENINKMLSDNDNNITNICVENNEKSVAENMNSKNEKLENADNENDIV